MTIPDKRILNFAGFLMCAALMGYALYAQHYLMLEPCPLCILQRIAVVGMGLVFLLAALHNPGGVGRFVYALLLVLPMSLGAIVAGRHAWLQMLPEDQVPACGPGLDYMWENFPLADVINMVFRGSGECADVDWQLLGLSMPAWVFIAVIALGSIGIWNNVRRV
ncbi:MAG: disulfide bond formation protein B [Proteobacteria bacterium]|nr:disulfide bond formation protein B [Pseudomonadota bacterium]